MEFEKEGQNKLEIYEAPFQIFILRFMIII